MGSSASRASRAAGSAARQYPKRPPPTSQATSRITNAPPLPAPAPGHRPGPTVRPQPHASTSRDEVINLDASDPDFARSLREVGPVQPNTTLSPSSTFPYPSNANKSAAASRSPGPDPLMNPAIAVLDARSKLQDAAESEFMEARRRGQREFLDVFTIRQILVHRDAEGKSAAEIERKLGLKKGLVYRLGVPGVFGLVREMGRERKEVDIV